METEIIINNFMDLKNFIEKFVEALDIEDAETLTGETLFRNLDEWSSLSILSLIVLFDEEFDKQIGDSDIKNCKTVADLYTLATA